MQPQEALMNGVVAVKEGASSSTDHHCVGSNEQKQTLSPGKISVSRNDAGKKKKRRSSNTKQRPPPLFSDSPSETKQRYSTSSSSRINRVLKAKRLRIIRNKNAMKRIPKVLKAKQQRVIRIKNAIKRIAKILKKKQKKKQAKVQSRARKKKKKKVQKLKSILKKKIKKKRDGKDQQQRTVTFRDVVQTREYERILISDEQLFVHYVYACLALGWNYNPHTETSQVNLDVHDQKRRSSSAITITSQHPTISLQVMTPTEGKIEREEKEELSPLFPRSTATERVAILTEYGYGLKEVIANEMRLKKKLQKQRKNHQQQLILSKESEQQNTQINIASVASDNMKRVLSSAYNNLVKK